MWVGQIMYKYENERKKERGRGEEDREDTVGEMIDYRDRGKERERKKEERRDTKDSTLLDLKMKGGSQKPRNACEF